MAWRTTHSVRARMWPVSSAMAMKRSGETKPRRGWLQRIRASTPVMASAAQVVFGLIGHPDLAVSRARSSARRSATGCRPDRHRPRRRTGRSRAAAGARLVQSDAGAIDGRVDTGPLSPRARPMPALRATSTVAPFSLIGASAAAHRIVAWAKASASLSASMISPSATRPRPVRPAHRPSASDNRRPSCADSRAMES